ncbi:hypothetical protein F6X40_36365 [Paraburkholderia sp. UCT31]|uniref:hypothetical protein n=1 Tax=Paraburkholderia sp. UCT31 TaxID=2615209 RepID=UPI00165507A4|nr:hypothetical protein [Paraburkholderia sp. UCT31]MBC8742016.1 hypothetical protein [Paraburkholderia sp. UCT31]
MNILITGARAPISLDIAKTLASTGHRVWMSDSLLFPIGAASPHIQGYVRTPPPRQAFNAFTHALQQACARNYIDLIIPTSEEVFWLALAKARELITTRVFAPPLAKLLALHDKWLFAQTATELGYGAGENRLLTSREAVEALEEDVDWVLKPVFSRFAARTLISPTPKALRRVTPTSQDPWLAQERAHGPEYCTYNIAEDGELLLHVAYRPKWRAGKGASVYFEPYADARLREMAAALAARQRLSGQFSLDAIDTGDRLVALECNPRGTSGVHLAAQFPTAFSDALLGQGKAPELQPHPAMLGLPLKLFNPLRAIGGALKADLARARECVNEAGVGLMPSIAATVEMFARAALHGTGVLAATTRDIEWNHSSSTQDTERRRV